MSLYPSAFLLLWLASGKAESKKPSMENLVKLASLFGVTTDYLLDHSPAMPAQDNSAEEHQLILIFRQLNQTGRNLLLASAESCLSQPALRQEGSVASEK